MTKTTEANTTESPDTKEEVAHLRRIVYKTATATISPPLHFTKNDIFYVNDDCELYGEYVVTDAYVTEDNKHEYVTVNLSAEEISEDNAFAEKINNSDSVSFGGLAVRITKNKKLANVDEEHSEEIDLDEEEASSQNARDTKTGKGKKNNQSKKANKGKDK